MADKRSYTGGRFAFSLNGEPSALISKVTPGAFELDVADIQHSTSNVIGKQTVNMKNGEWTFEVGVGMSKGIYDLMNAAMDQQAAPFSGQLSIADFNYKEQRIIEFHDALITSVALPKFASDSKEIFKITIGFTPERVEYRAGGGSDIRGKLGPAQKAYSCNNYRVDIGGLPCRRVTEVDALKWTVKTASEYMGEFALPTLHCAKVERPELTCTISASDAEEWEKNFHSFAVQGNRLVSNEMSGTIEILDPTLTKPVASVVFKQIGWKKFQSDPMEANSDKTSKVKATLWVEETDFVINEYDA
jgi:hypothetical protein